MQTDIRQSDSRTVVLAPVDRLDAFTVPAFRQRLESCWNQGALHFVIDLSNTVALDSAGVAALVHLFKRTRQQGGTTKIVSPKAESAQRILRLTHFDRIFNMVEYAAA
jgi:anti-sigma B factor antagonist